MSAMDTTPTKPTPAAPVSAPPAAAIGTGAGARRGGRVETVVNLTFMVTLLIGFALTRNIGLADNGDFARSATWFTSGPVGISASPDDYEYRFFNYWLPYWNLDWPGEAQVRSSAALLWLPGVLLSTVLTPGIVYLPIMSLPALVFLAVLFWLVLRWIERNRNLWLYVILALPLLLLIIDAYYLARLNSFYQDGPAFVYLTAVTIAVAWFVEKRTWPALVACAILSLLLGASQAGHFFWPILVLAVCIWQADDRHMRIVAGVILVASVGVAVWLLPASPEMQQNSAGQSLLTGVIAMSDAPQERLREIGLSLPDKCIGRNVFSEVGDECFRAYRDKMTYANVLRVIVAEPIVVIRLIRYASSRMGEVATNLGYFTEDDPLAGRSSIPSVGLRLWATVKRWLFPRGNLLLIGVAATAIVAYGLSGQSGPVRTVSVVALLMASGCLAEILVSVLGDGRADLVRHLFISNAAFDLLLLSFGSLLVLVGIQHPLRFSQTRRVVGSLACVVLVVACMALFLDTMRRANFAVLLSSSYSRATHAVLPDTQIEITDIGHLSAQEQQAIRALYGLEITSGTSRTGMMSEFSPDKTLLPDQVFTFVMRWFRALFSSLTTR